MVCLARACAAAGRLHRPLSRTRGGRVPAGCRNRDSTGRMPRSRRTGRARALDVAGRLAPAPAAARVRHGLRYCHAGRSAGRPASGAHAGARVRVAVRAGGGAVLSPPRPGRRSSGGCRDDAGRTRPTAGSVRACAAGGAGNPARRAGRSARVRLLHRPGREARPEARGGLRRQREEGRLRTARLLGRLLCRCRRPRHKAEGGRAPRRITLRTGARGPCQQRCRAVRAQLGLAERAGISLAARDRFDDDDDAGAGHGLRPGRELRGAVAA